LGGELLEPEARLPARVAELIVRGQNHQDLHEPLLSSGATSTSTTRGGAVRSKGGGTRIASFDMGQLPESCRRGNAAVASWDQDEGAAAPLQWVNSEFRPSTRRAEVK
jgi:hypothetical protein